MERPYLSKDIDSKVFRSFYYLKEELVDFCKRNGLPTSGGKIELTDRIAYFLETGEVQSIIKTKYTANHQKTNKSDNAEIGISKGTNLTLTSTIEENYVCSEDKRAFFKEVIGKQFSFNVIFMNWLKSNAGKTYQDAVDAYYKILEDKKKNKTTIDKQFEYNTYIRDFFEDNKGKSLDDAIRCWKYKKQLQGHNCYEKADLIALK